MALVAGLLTGVAAVFGGFMNANFLLAGTVSSNPVLFLIAIGVAMAWRVAGHYGLDRLALPMLGVPGAPGKVFRRAQAAPQAAD